MFYCRAHTSSSLLILPITHTETQCVLSLSVRPESFVQCRCVCMFRTLCPSLLNRRFHRFRKVAARKTCPSLSMCVRVCVVVVVLPHQLRIVGLSSLSRPRCVFVMRTNCLLRITLLLPYTIVAVISLHCIFQSTTCVSVCVHVHHHILLCRS